MGENEFYLAFWRAALTTIAVVVVSVAGCTAHSKRVISNVIESGAHPLDAQCALDIDADKSRCAIRATISLKDSPAEGPPNHGL